MQVEIEQGFPVGWQVVRQVLNLHKLLHTRVQTEQAGGSNQGDGGVGIVLVGIDPGLGGENLGARVGDHDRRTARVAGMDHACITDGQGCLGGR
ncbi:hypothetical protein D3C78_1512870 [compost metagenome]